LKNFVKRVCKGLSMYSKICNARSKEENEQVFTTIYIYTVKNSERLICKLP